MPPLPIATRLGPEHDSNVRSLSGTVVALACVIAITPGIRELVLDAAHWAADGHVAHADACPDGEGDEHGCTGAFHSCPCHASASITAPRPQGLTVFVPVERRAAYLLSVDQRGPAGFTRRLIRPPSA